MGVRWETGPASPFVRLGRGLRFVSSFLLLGVVTAAATWLAVVTLPGLGSLVAAIAGLGATGAALTHGLGLLFVLIALLGGGLLSDRVLGRGAIGTGALSVGLGALAAALLPGALTTAIVALSSVVGVGILLPALVVQVAERAGHNRVGAAFGLVGAGYLLSNVVLLWSWYALANWLGLAASSHLLGDGVAGLAPRVLVYETFVTWQQALLVIGGGLVAAAVVWFAVIAMFRTDPRTVLEREDTLVWSSPPEPWPPLRQRSVQSVFLASAAVAWTAATGLLVYSETVGALTAPIMVLAGRQVSIPLLIGLLVAGLVLDYGGLRGLIGVSLFGGVLGPMVYSLVAGPATQSVGATPDGTPLLILSLFVTGLAVAGLVVSLFALALSVPDDAPDRQGVATGIVLGVGFVATVVARAIVPVDGRASPFVLMLLVGPAVFGLVSLRWVERGPKEVSVGRASPHAESGEIE